MASTLKRLTPRAEQPAGGQGLETGGTARPERVQFSEAELALQREFGPEAVKAEGEYVRYADVFDDLEQSAVQALTGTAPAETGPRGVAEIKANRRRRDLMESAGLTQQYEQEKGQPDRLFVSLLEKNVVARANFAHKANAVAFEAMTARDGGGYDPDHPDGNFEVKYMPRYFQGQPEETQKGARQVVSEMKAEVSYRKGNVEVPKQGLRKLDANGELDVGVAELSESRDLVSAAIRALQENGVVNNTNREKIKLLKAHEGIMERLQSRLRLEETMHKARGENVNARTEEDRQELLHYRGQLEQL